MISGQSTGHVTAHDGRLLRVDVVGGRWVATRFGRDLKVTDVVYGTMQEVHDVVERWRAYG
jgi:hypothetical protein